MIRRFRSIYDVEIIYFHVIGQTLVVFAQLPYYKNAIAEMENRITGPSYYVFSDDISWVKENIPLKKAVYVTWNKGEDSWQDMMLMSHCRHHIICNSTFSWWGAC